MRRFSYGVKSFEILSKNTMTYFLTSKFQYNCVLIRDDHENIVLDAISWFCFFLVPLKHYVSLLDYDCSCLIIHSFRTASIFWNKNNSKSEENLTLTRLLSWQHRIKIFYPFLLNFISVFKRLIGRSNNKAEIFQFERYWIKNPETNPSYSCCHYF